MIFMYHCIIRWNYLASYDMQVKAKLEKSRESISRTQSIIAWYLNMYACAE